MIVGWLNSAAVIYLGICCTCFAIVVAHILMGRHQHMWIMNIVWPVTMLYAGPAGLWFYFSSSRKDKKPARWERVCLATMHCGSGCTVADICTGIIMLVHPFTLFGMKLYGGWLLGYLLAFTLGIAFPYFTIQPMNKLPAGEALRLAIKADSLSLTAWQMGMYGWMAVTVLLIFGRELSASHPAFWLMMQIAMLAGFGTSFPVNWWLVNTGVKKKML